MREKLERYKLIKRTVAALNRQPRTRARGASVYEFVMTDEPDIAVVTHGRAVFLTVNTPLNPATPERLARLDLWRTRSNARCAVVDSVEGAVAIVAEVASDAAEQDEALGEVTFERGY